MGRPRPGDGGADLGLGLYGNGICHRIRIILGDDPAAALCHCGGSDGRGELAAGAHADEAGVDVRRDIGRIPLPCVYDAAGRAEPHDALKLCAFQ